MKKALVLCITLCMLAGAFALNSFAADRQIGNAADLANVMLNSDTWGDNITLTADISLEGNKQSPIGSYDIPFTGTFDGAGHTISGLNIQANGTAGLFGVAENATIKNLTVKGSVNNIFGEDIVNATAETKITEDSTLYPGTGGIVAIVSSGCVLENLVSYVNASGHGNIGGVVGIIYNFGENAVNVSGLKNYGKVEPLVGNCGGVIGRIYVKSSADKAVVVDNCANYADVISQSEDRNRVGGVVGYVRSELGTIDIKNCYNEGDIIGTNSKETGSNIPYAGGISGRNEVTGGSNAALTIADCINVGEIKSSRIGGGITAYISRGETCLENRTAVMGCVNTGAVDASYFAGGIVAYTSSSFFPAVVATATVNCLNAAPVVSEDCAGGIIGRQVGVNIDKCVNLGISTATKNCGGLIGQTEGSLATEVYDSYYLYNEKVCGADIPFLVMERVAPIASADAAKQEIYAGLDFASEWTMTAAGPVPVCGKTLAFTVPEGIVAEVAPAETTAPETTAEETTAPETTAEETTAEETEEAVTTAEATTATPASEEEGSSLAFIIPIVAAVIVVIGIVVFVIKKKK